MEVANSTCEKSTALTRLRFADRRYSWTAWHGALSVQSHVLEAHLQGQLDVPTVPGSREPAGIRADDSIAIGRVINEVCAVQDVEKFRPELQVPSFTQKPDGGVLVQ